jgi:ABC-type uncharacterized transport system ATPase subunit
VPSEYGIQKHPLFCLKRKPAKVIKRKLSDDMNDMESQKFNKNILNHDDPIKILGLTKKFGNFSAVSDLSLSIREGEIFTILGHNGAGKTTLIYMLTGVHKPSKGDALIYGLSIS